MVKLLMSKTKELTDVYGMSKIAGGTGPAMLRFRYTRYVEINDPKNRHSDPRKNHINSFRLFKPVEVRSGATGWAEVKDASAKVILRKVGYS
jgi:hypothetical protein